MNLTVVGAGYVGLSNAILLSLKHKVTLVDIVEEKVSLINNKQSPISDKYIEDYLKSKQLNLTATMDKAEAFKNADYVIICTPTDYNDVTKFLNTDSVDETIDLVLRVNPLATIIIRSTIPIGYVDKARKCFKKEDIFFSPEFLREGNALKDNLYPSRIVIGGNCERAKKFAQILSECAISPDIPLVFTNTIEAESIKLFANTYLAMRVAFFNELDTYAELKDLNTKQIIEGICLDPRIGHNYNNPSFGYGGYCLPKDTKQLKSNFANIPNDIITAIVAANETRKNHLVNQIKNKNAGVVGVYRLIAKSETDNFRQSSILGIIKSLSISEVSLVIYEPSLNVDSFMGVDVIKNFDDFKKTSDLIIANRVSSDLKDVEYKVYSRDIFSRD